MADGRMGLTLVIAVDDQSGLVCSIVKPGSEFDEPIDERSLFVEGGAVIHDLHCQWHDVEVQSREFGEQFSVSADHELIGCRRR